MKSLALAQCPLCLKYFDYRNLTTGVCHHCQYLIDSGDDAIIDRYLALDLSEITTILEENDLRRLERR